MGWRIACPRALIFRLATGRGAASARVLRCSNLDWSMARVAQHFRFKLVPGHPVVPEPLVTLRAKYGIKMTIHARP